MKNKKGKKLVVLGAMAALLTLIGVSGSQTYAKYVESKDVTSNSATVAKWGFVASASTELFGENYGQADDDDFASVTSSATDLTVDADDATLAPGTKGTMNITITGKAEVDVDFTFSSQDDCVDVNLAELYYPVDWSLSVTGTTDIGSVNSGSLKDVMDEITGSTVHFDANTPVNVVITISWEWKFDNAAETTTIPHYDGSGNLNGDDADTILAILSNGAGYSMEFDYDECVAAYNTGSIKSSWTTSFDLTVTATQSQNPHA